MAQDVFSEMAMEPWILNEDGYLNVNTNIKEIVYHPSLNVILISSKSGTVHVLDVNSGVILLSSSLSAANVDSIKCKYITGQDRILFTDGQAIGVRSDYNGVLLLDSILQKTVLNTKEKVKLELPLSEAVILKQSLTLANIHGIDLVSELSEVISNAQKHSKKGIKAQKWNTVCLQLPIDVFQSIAAGAVAELLIKNQHTPELGVASAVQERLSELLGEQANATDRKSMASESRRRETFSHWPHMDYKWALPDQMAQAGFYHQPNSAGDDRAMCFTCSVCLVCWERTDEPWSEHERHSSNCPFVMGEYTQNVPLSVTQATNPAIDSTYRGVNLSVIGTSSVPDLLPTANSDGLISVFDISGKIKRAQTFFVTQFDSHVLERLTQDFDMQVVWTRQDEIEKKISALTIVSENCKQIVEKCETITEKSNIRPTVICGLTINKIDDQKHKEGKMQSNLYLVVYDFQYTKELENEVDGTISEGNMSNYIPIENSMEHNEITDLSQLVPDSEIMMDSPYSFLKQAANYKSFIPDDVSSIYIPPTYLPKTHSGPYILSFQMQNTDTDSTHTNSLTKINSNDQSIAENTDISISDHIKELKNSKSHKLNYSRTVQCVSLPNECKNVPSLEISNIITTQDKNHILVVVTSQTNSKSFLLVYELNYSDKMVKIRESVTLMCELQSHEKPIEVTMLPPLEKFKEFSVGSKNNGVEGTIVLVCKDGEVQVMELSTLKTICVAKLETEKFVSATYCNSLERLCISTENGSLHFYALNETDNESSEEHDDEDLFNINDNTSLGVSQNPIAAEINEARCFNEPIDVISISELKRLYLLCDFEPLKATYCTVVPPCWSEIQQALRQRKNHPKVISETDQCTKTWRLQTDTTTWDEHIFEISLPTNISLGHVDVQFALQPSTSVPHVEVTLLRQNSNGIGHKRDVKFGVDESITIDMLQWVDNPVISQEYLRAHNAEILAGPINLASNIDLIDQSATVTLTSPKLFRSKCRTLLLHVRAVYTKEELNQKNKPKPFETLLNNIDMKLNGNRKTDLYMGCDCIHELSVTICNTKTVSSANERSQRNFMLESNVFIQSLFYTANKNCTNETLCHVLDILNWVASIRLSRNRSNNGDAPNHQLDFISIMQSGLSALIQKCLLLGGRSIAYKCMKLVMICCSGAKNIHETVGENFNCYVLSTVLTMFDNVNSVKSAGGLQWIFALAVKVANRDKELILSNKCVEVLSKISNELNKRVNPYHLLLRSRYGLYGTPMEPELFDLDLPAYIKPTNSTQSASAAACNNANADFFSNYSNNKESINPKDILFNYDTKLKYKNVASTKLIKGLIETVALHFNCVSASEGTRLERADLSNTFDMFSYTMAPNNTAGPLANFNIKDNIPGLIHYYVEKQLNEGYQFKTIRQQKDSGTSQDEAGQSKCVVKMYVQDDQPQHKNIVADTLYENIAKALENAKIANHHEETNVVQSNACNYLPWQQLLIVPPQQVIVVERMHSGARRHVTLDFGQPVLLTDIIIPSCSDLVSLSIDIWLKGEDVDETRLCLATDIGSRNLLLKDLQPLPICRYMKITAVGRIGMQTSSCRIPAGYFYGHIIILPEEIPISLADESANLVCKDLEKQLTILSNLLEDIHCRYSLACSKLKDLLQPYIVSNLKNTENLFTFININKDNANNVSNVEHMKILSAYQDATNFQHQLNTVKNVMVRIEESLNTNLQFENKNQELASCSTDKLRTISEGIVEVLLSIDAVPNIEPDICKQLFNGLCICQLSRLELLSAIFLDKTCGKKTFWPNFLADTIYTMFSTTYNVKFPQDRLFILLNFLSRRTTERSALIDATLRVLSETLKPLLDETQKSLLAISIDLSLLSWLLMFLSLQLDLTTSNSTASRWNFVFGEVVEKNSQENTRNIKKKSCKRNYTSSGSQSTLAQYHSKLNNAFKTHELVMKGDKLKLKYVYKKAATDPTSKNGKDNPDTNNEKTLKKMPQHMDKLHCQIVAKGLLNFILSMDHSSSSDMMLLAFKVAARLVTLAKLQLGQLLNEEKLLKLITLCINSKIQWSMMALTCFLEDAVQMSHSNYDDAEMETQTASSSWCSNDLVSDMISDVESICESFNIDSVVEPLPKQGKSTTNNNLPPLPSVFESDDSELEDLMEEFDSKLRRSAKKVTKTTFHTNQNISTATDYRLELGVTSNSEINIKKLLIKNSEKLFCNISNGVKFSENETSLPSWPTPLGILPLETQSSNYKMLIYCFESLFENWQIRSPAYIEEVTNFWLNINCSIANEKYDPSIIPKVTLKAEYVTALVSALAWTPGLTLTSLCTSLQVLTLVCNTNCENMTSLWADISGMTTCIITHPDTIQFFLRLLSARGFVFPGKVVAGPTLCKALHHFLVRLQMRSDIVSASSKLGVELKTLLLKVVHQLIQPLGPIANRQGPIDAQYKLLQSMLYMDFANTDPSIALSIFESTGAFLHCYLENVEQVKCINIGERPTSVTNTFSDIFASVLGSDSNKADRPVSYDLLLITLLRLLRRFIETPIPSQEDTPTAGTSQTDESKAEQIQIDTLRNVDPTPCFADLVVEHYPCIIHLCHSLASCKSSSISMLVNVTQKGPFNNLNEVTTVGDAVFNVLALLAKKVSNRELLMQPLLLFLSQTSQLSEPLLWFILQVIENEEAIKLFLNAGGIEVLSQKIVESANAPNTIARIGMISTVMQHFSGNNQSSESTTLVPSSCTKKVIQATIESKMSVTNFAPNCTIKCMSATAQPADVLVQGLGGVTHRRARTPLWSYHFYPDEAHTDLVLQLPSAVLLKEVQLQPHTIGLATCPSAVSLEISSNGPSRLVPACTPIPTSGMTYIRLNLPAPKVVNCVLIRLYKPRDANSIGLLQIRLLGTTAYGGYQALQENSDDEVHCKHSLGWLRLLHHCFTLPNDQNVTKMVIRSASNDDLLNCCCGLLLVPSHILPIYMQCLERVLRDLALFNLQNGVMVIRSLLGNKCNIIEPSQIQTISQDRYLINSSSDFSVCEILYQICDHQDSDTLYRITIVLEWLQQNANKALLFNNTENINSVYISCIASILWNANENEINYDLKCLITHDLFSSIFNLKILAKNNKNLKYAIDALLCSCCYINSDFYPLLLQKLGILVPNLSTDHGASISDDRKDSESLTDDNKCDYEVNSEWYSHLVMGDLSNISNEQLETIALVSRSSTAIKQLLDSGFPKLLNKSILDFCYLEEDSLNSMEQIISILRFFCEVSDERIMRDWLGSIDGSSFWPPLLHKLCKKPCTNKSNLPSETHMQLGEVFVKLLSKCCLCHSANQYRLSKVLCEVIALEKNGMSGFLRRIILQLLLEYEKVPVSISAEENLYKSIKVNQAWLPLHPGCKISYNKVMLYLSTNTTLYDILEQHVYFNKNFVKVESTLIKKGPSVKKTIYNGWYPEESDLSMAAGVTAKDKRAKDGKSSNITNTPLSKKKKYTSAETTLDDTESISGRIIKCSSLGNQPLSLSLNLSQLLKLIESKGSSADWPCIHLSIYQSKNSDDKKSSSPEASGSSYYQPLESALQVFSSMGGLALLAQHLPTVYPEAVRMQVDKNATEASDSDWIKVEECDDIYEDVEETVGTASPSKTSGSISHIPSHSLTAFGLFLRLPGYAELLLKDMKRALCLLRLVLGVTDDGEDGDIFQSSVADSLPTLPFEILRKLYNATPLSTDDGRLLRRISINSGVAHLIIVCISIFTHHSPDGEKDDQKQSKEERTQLYWAKGTGFGTGSTQQSWNVEQALLKQKSEEEHVTVLLQVLASYINPNDQATDELAKEVLPPTFSELLENSALIPALSSYLKNDSVFDIARHIPLYKSILQLLRAMATSSQLVQLLIPKKAKNEPSLCSLLKSMKNCVNAYASKLKINGSKKVKNKFGDQVEELEQGEGLAALIPDIQETTSLVSSYTDLFNFKTYSSDNDSDREDITDLESISPEEHYIRTMKQLQFGSFEMIKEMEGSIKFVVSHHFESNAKAAGETSHPARVKRIAQEAVTLSTSLPLSYSSSVFVRYDTSRLDVMKVLIIGPSDTPYANGCFELDVFFPPDYPLSPMMINLETTGHHSVRFNPNLYNDGKVCLSVLNTWHGRPEEKWNPSTSSFLQVLVSIQSLILVPEPYFNEPGFERARGTPAGTSSSKDYNLNICQATVRWAMLEQILNPCPCFKDIIHTHFYLKKDEVIAQVEKWVKELEEDVTKEKKSTRSTKKTPASTLETFKGNFTKLKEHLYKLQLPDKADCDNNKKETESDEDMENVVNDMINDIWNHSDNE